MSLPFKKAYAVVYISEKRQLAVLQPFKIFAESAEMDVTVECFFFPLLKGLQHTFEA